MQHPMLVQRFIAQVRIIFIYAIIIVLDMSLSTGARHLPTVKPM